MKPLVSVLMVTYNHEKFIGQALDSVFSQQVDFEFEVVLGEDCSTDSTRLIVQEYERRYPLQLFPIYHQRNVGVKRNGWEFCFPKLRGEFVATFEGDDLWIDRFKLQRQVDFLRANPNFSACCHISQTIDDNGVQTSQLIGNFPDQTFFEADFSKGYKRIATASILFRNRFKESPPLLQSVYGGDRALLFLLSQQGPIHVMNFVGSAYRVHGNSQEATYRQDKKRLAIRNIEENRVYLGLIASRYKTSMARKIRWNYFYLLVMYVREMSFINALTCIPELIRYQLISMGFHSVIPKK